MKPYYPNFGDDYMLLLCETYFKLELWVTSLSDTPRLQYYDVQTLEYRYINKLPMKKGQDLIVGDTLLKPEQSLGYGQYQW
jgi:hypothetical protein